jgi:outer membrane biosynthesis protein TonB
MYSFSINKKIDYSAPILFVPLGSPMAEKSVPLQKVIATKQSVIQPTPKPKIEAQKTTMAPVKSAVKSSSAKTMADTKRIEESEKKVDPLVPQEKAKPEPIKSSSAKASVDKENKVAKALDIQSSIVETSDLAKASSNATSDTMANKQNAIPVPSQKKIENAQISHDFREVEALRCGAQLQKELAQQWHPPVGVSSDCTCDISFFVNKKGTIENLKIVKGSGVMMFDISARQALFAMQMPQWTYGKPLIISFKQ